MAKRDRVGNEDSARRTPRSWGRTGAGSIAALATLLVTSAPVFAQGAPPPPPPQGYAPAPPPPGYEAQPPPQAYYGQPPPNYYVPPGSYGMQQGVGPKYLEWDEGDPIQPGYHPTTRIRKGLVIGGAVTFGTTYLLTAMVAALAVEAGEGSQFAPLFAPAIGPFITVGTSHASTGGAFVLIIDGLAQTGGLAMLIAGIAAPKPTLVRNDVARVKVTPIPMTFGHSSAGVGLVGTF